MVILAIICIPFAGALLLPAAAYAGAGRPADRQYAAGQKKGFLPAAAAAISVCAVILALGLLLLCMTRTGGTRSFAVTGILTEGLSFESDGFRSAYAVISAFMWLMTSLFSLEYFSQEPRHMVRYWFFTLLTLGAVEGVMLSADLMTAFVFFEILSFSSFVWVIHEETAEASRAAYTYLFIAVIGGLVLFMGLLLLRHTAGTLSFAALKETMSMRTGGSGSGSMAGGAAEGAVPAGVLAAGLCILFGFGAKAGMFPVHIWLPKAHPVAPSPASALLSGILTKVGIFGILMTVLHVFPSCLPYGRLILAAGAVTMLLGAVLALFSVSLKRTLACSSMSQIGFILTGTGMYVLLQAAEEEHAAVMTLAGVMLHMVNHSLIKLVLFMAAGVAVMGLHVQDLNSLRGWGRNKRFLKAAFALGALGISGVPLFNGYISKTLLHEGIVEGISAYGQTALRVLEWVFLVSGGLTFAYMLKLFICIFCERNTDRQLQKRYDAQPRCMNRLSTAVICGPSALMILLGQPAIANRIAVWMTGSPVPAAFRAFTAENLKGGAISLGIGALVYLAFVRRVILRKGLYRDLWPAWLDLENLLYRPALTRVLPAVFGQIAAIFGENRILAPVCRTGLRAAGILTRVFADSTDALIWLLRRTVVSEKKSRDPAKTRGRRLRAATAASMSAVLDGFSFAMMMTCIGIVIMLGVLLWMTVFR